MSGISAQQHFIHELVNEETRASFGAVHNLYQDSLGILWLGHYGKGLKYYDGINIRQIELQNEGVFADKKQVFEAARGKLYLNYGHSVHLFDPIQQQVADSIPVVLKGDAPARLSHIEVPEDGGGVWGIQKLTQSENTGGQNTYHIYFSPGDDSIRRITAVPLITIGEPVIKAYGNNCIVKDTAGLMLLDTSGRVKMKFPLPGFQLDKMDNNNLDIDDQNRLWGHRANMQMEKLEIFFIDLRDWSIHFYQAFPNRLLRLKAIDRLNEFLKDVPQEPVYLELLRVFGDELYLVTEAECIKIDILTGEYFYINQYIQNKGGNEFRYVQDLMVDRSGILYLGMKIGLGKWMAQPDVFQIIPRISIRGFVEDEQGRIYGANGYDAYGPGTGISIYEPKENRVEWLDVPFFPYWYSAIYKTGKLYFGLKEFDLGTGRFKNFDYNTKTIDDLGTINHLLVGDREIWTAKWGGEEINVFDIQNLKPLKTIPIPPLRGASVDLNDMYLRSSDSTIWLGTFGKGVFVFSKTGELLRHLSISSDNHPVLTDNIVSSFYEDQHRNIWIGHASGISKIRADFSDIEHFAIDPKRPNYYIVYGILPENDDRYLWISTNYGIYRFDSQTGIFMDFPLNPLVMDVEYNRTSYHRAGNGRLYFGGTDKRSKNVAFFPQDVVEYYLDEEKGKAPVFVSQFSKYDGRNGQLTVQNQGLGTLEKIVIRPGDRYFTLDFLLGDLRSPEDHYYSYYLKNYEKGWNEPKRFNNQVKYENLPPGQYTLKMRAALMREHLPLNELQLKVTVLPYWYQTWWSRVLFVLLALGALYFIVRSLLRRQLEKQEASRLRDLDEFKTKLYNNITHEFRTPLTVILGMNEHIEGNQRERHLIQRNAQSLLRLVNQMLDLSKLDAGNLNLDTIQGNIIDYMEYLADSFYSLALDKNVVLDTRFPAEEIIMDFDEEKIQYVFYNLLSNAIKFTPPGGRVSFRAESSRTPSGTFLKVEVEDSGQGIPKSALPHIFDRFYQVQDDKDIQNRKSSEYNSNPGGTGIGLALTQELVELMGGSIQVESEPGKGTLFQISLPVVRMEDTPIRSNSSVSSAELATTASVKEALETPISKPAQPLILIIEDTKGVADYLQLLLANDYNLQFATDGQQGIDQAFEHIPDLIITDVMMPKKDGFQVCEALKRDTRTSHIPIIMLTARADMGSKIEGLEVGADAYLSKPFEKEELLVRLRKLLELRVILQQKYQYYTASQDLPESTKVESTEPDIEKEFLHNLIHAIESRLDDTTFTIPDLSQAVAMSHTQLYRKLKAITGKTPSQFIRSIRLRKAMQLLKTTNLNISEIAYDVGFNGPQYFNKVFKEEFGYPPGKVRE